MTEIERDQVYMQYALELANKARLHGEVPVGAVLVLNNEIIGEGFNRSILNNDPSAHAEIVALRTGAAYLSNYRLLNTTLYVTLEPCSMCAGAMLHARIKRLVFGAYDPKSGAAGSVLQVVDNAKLNHTVDCHGGLMAEPCGKILKDFFVERRR